MNERDLIPITITISGGRACGKSSLAAMLYDFFSKCGGSVDIQGQGWNKMTKPHLQDTIQQYKPINPRGWAVTIIEADIVDIPPEEQFETARINLEKWKNLR